MPVTVTWGSEERTHMCYTIVEPWQWDDFYTAIAAGRAMRQQENVAVIDVVFDVTQARKIPYDALTQINIMGRRDSIVGPHVRRIVIVGANAFLQSILTMVGRVAPRLGDRVVLADSPEEVHGALEAGA